MTVDDASTPKPMALWAEEAGARVLNLASGEDCDLPQLREAVEKLNAGATLGNIGTARTTPLHLAAGFGKGKAVHHLLMAGHDALVHSGAGRTPLHDACLGGHSEVLQLIVDAIPNHDCNVFDKEHQSPVHLAAYHGELKCMEVLAKAGADLKAVDTHGRQACHMAAKRNHAHILKFLFDHGVNLSVTCNSGRLPVHYASQFGGLEAITCLVQHETDLTRGDANGNLPLHLAARHGHLDCLRFLVKMKVPLSVLQKDGKQPTHVAAQHGATGCLHWLLEKGADPNAQDAVGHTASHYACENNNAESLNCLLNHDAFPHVANLKGEIPMDAARRAGHPLHMQKAVTSDIKCPFCVQKFKRLEWEKANQPTHVEAALIRTKNTIYNNPVPSEGESPVTITNKTATDSQEKRDLTAKFYGEHF